jgi:hypothetical protein
MRALDDLQQSTALDAAATAALRAELAHERARRIAAEHASHAAVQERDQALATCHTLELKLSEVELETAQLAQQLHSLLFGGAEGVDAHEARLGTAQAGRAADGHAV